MPPIVPQTNNLLSIALAEKHEYRAGETIVGTVTRRAHFVDSDATLTIKFLGRCKVRLVISHGQGSNTYRSRYIFWDSRHPPSSATLYKGPVHIPPNTEEPQSWPFAIFIPATIPEDTIKQEESDATFLKPGDPETMQLPGSFLCDDNHFWGDTFEAYVDYHLEAVLRDSKGSRFEARLPIKVNSVSSPFPITDFGLRNYRGEHMSLSTHRLNPAFAEGKLSFGQKAQQVFGSSKVPTLMLQVVAQTPSVLQIGNPNIVPFQVRAFLDKAKTSEVIRDLQPTLFITYFCLQLTATCSVIAPGTFSSHDKTGDVTWTLMQHTRRRPLPAASGSSAADVAQSGSKNDEAEQEKQLRNEEPPDADTLIMPLDSAPLPLDLGKALGIRLPRTLGQQEVTPTFKTFNIHNTHTLTWHMRLEAADKELTFRGSHSVNVMPLSEQPVTQERVPAYNAAQAGSPSVDQGKRH